jgi:hypothetical protein
MKMQLLPLDLIPQNSTLSNLTQPFVVLSSFTNGRRFDAFLRRNELPLFFLEHLPDDFILDRVSSTSGLH